MTDGRAKSKEPQETRTEYIYLYTQEAHSHSQIMNDLGGRHWEILPVADHFQTGFDVLRLSSRAEALSAVPMKSASRKVQGFS